MAVVVARPKLKIPDFIATSLSDFALDAQQWIQIEGALGRPLDPRTRQEILSATLQFLQYAEMESDSNTGLMSDAVKRAKRLRKHARSLLDVIDATSGSLITRTYVNRLVGSANLNALSAELKCLERACDVALGQMADMSRYQFSPDGQAWDMWIQQLTKIAKEHDLPTGARKDTDKTTAEIVSKFVAFVDKLQAYIPAARRRATQSKQALSVAINTARRRPKTPVSRVR